MLKIVIFILIGLGLGSVVGVFFWIRGLCEKNKNLKKKNKDQAAEINFYQKNKQAYQVVIDKLMEDKKDAESIKEKINNSDSSDLADILNEL